MKSSRRGFLGALLGGAASAMTLDLDKMLFVPGEKIISIPPVLAIERTPMPDMVILESIDSPIAVARPRVHLGSVHLEGTIDSFFWEKDTSRRTVEDVHAQIQQAANISGKLITATVKLGGGKFHGLCAEPEYGKFVGGPPIRMFVGTPSMATARRQ